MNVTGALRVNYLLASTDLHGGVAVVLHQANLLRRRGHNVRVVSPGTRPGWYPLEAEFLRVRSFDDVAFPAGDVTVATFWTTIQPAVASGSEAVQYCQGFEGALSHNTDEHAAIEEAYRTPVPALTVSPHLANLIAGRFGRAARVVPPGLEPEWRGRLRWRPRQRPRVLVVGPFENYVKGVPVALEAVSILHDQGLPAALVRLTQWEPTADERSLIEPDELHFHLNRPDVPALVRSCDLLLAPSTDQEGFGLPVLEAMACGVPVVASDIPSFRAFAAKAAVLVPAGDPVAFAEAASEALEHPVRWRAMRRAGLKVAEQFREDRVAGMIEDALQWVVSGEWRAET